MNPFIKDIIAGLKQQSDFMGFSDDELVRLIEIPPDPKMGDFAVPCFTLAKKLGKSPADISKTASQAFPCTSLIPETQASGPYLNFIANESKLIEYVLSDIYEQGEAYGDSNIGHGKTVLLDYSSPNIAKHLAVHHLRSAVIGNSIKRLYGALGYQCVGINHLGDWGTQFGQLIVAFKRWGSEDALKENPIKYLNELYVKYHQEAENNPSLEDEAREWFNRLENGNEEAKALWQRFKDLSLQEFQRIYRLLDISFDFYTGESFYNELLNDTIKRIKDPSRGLGVMSEDALIVNLDKYNMPPCLLLKKDDTSLYATRDICAAEYRKRQFNFDKAIYVVGSEQRLHFKQFFKVLELMGYSWAKDCVHIDFGLMKFKDGKMSTRKGRVVLLEDLLKEAVERTRKIIEEKNPDIRSKEEIAHAVGIGAIIFADLSSKRVKDVIFDWDEILNFDGETGPYVQYSHARLCSIMRKYGQAVTNKINYALLKKDDELQLVKNLELFPIIIRRAAETYEPSLLSNLLLTICSTFNRYYNHHRILGNDEELTNARVLLCDSIRQVLRKGLYLLGIKAPVEM
ncbi:MAG: arginine--tRNA ligase [Candidatus Brocadiales bacterium]